MAPIPSPGQGAAYYATLDSEPDPFAPDEIQQHHQDQHYQHHHNHHNQQQHQPDQSEADDDDDDAAAAAALVSLHTQPSANSSQFYTPPDNAYPAQDQPLHIVTQLPNHGQSDEEMSSDDDEYGSDSDDASHHVASPVSIPPSPTGSMSPPPAAPQDFFTSIDISSITGALPPLVSSEMLSSSSGLDDMAEMMVSTSSTSSQGTPAFPHQAHVAQGNFGTWSDPAPNPPTTSNVQAPGNPTALWSEYFNAGIDRFLRNWISADNRRGTGRGRGRGPSNPGPTPCIDAVVEEFSRKPRCVRYKDLWGDEGDFQGVNWVKMGISRQEARERRLSTYRNFVSQEGSDMDRPGDEHIPMSENFFKFRRMDIRRNVRLSHFQLRNMLVSGGRSRVFYPTADAIHRLDPFTGQSNVAVDFQDEGGMHVTTLDCKDGVLVAGTIQGFYLMHNVYSGKKAYIKGLVADDNAGITNHLQIERSRTAGTPVVAFASNDQSFSLMDVATRQFTTTSRYNFAVNCSALSTDRRSRALVGDSHDVLIADADSGEVLTELSGHRDYGFACDWSDDGWTMATAAQDRTVKIWDARKWTDANGNGTPVFNMRTRMSGVRSLRFSAAGSGPPVLVAAEDADYVHVFDAKTFQGKQRFDVFSEIGGVAFADGDRDMHVLCCDKDRGGVLQFERDHYGSAPHDDYCPMGSAGAALEAAHPFRKKQVHLPEMEPF